MLDPVTHSKIENTGWTGFSLTTAIHPRWEGATADLLGITPEQKDKLASLYYATLLGTGIHKGSKKVKINDDGSLELRQNFGKDTHRSFVESVDSSQRQFNFSVPLEVLNEKLIKECAVYDNFSQFVKGTEGWLKQEGLTNYPGISKLAESPEATKEITDWLKKHGVTKLRLREHGGEALLFETNGDFMVRLQPKKTPPKFSENPAFYRRELINEPEILPPVFSHETNLAYIDIVPRMPGRAIGGKQSTPETVALQTSLASKGIDYRDPYAKNVMRLPDNTPIIVDLGSVKKKDYPSEHTQLEEDLGYSWLAEDGTPKTHKYCPWLADNAPKKAERFAKEAMSGGNYSVPHTKTVDELIQSVAMTLAERKDLAPEGRRMLARLDLPQHLTDIPIQDQSFVERLGQLQQTMRVPYV